MAQIYCGNNAQDPQLIAGEVEQGTPFGCMRKGVGIGLNLPYDAKYNGAYEPIDERRIYCGKHDEAPDGYHRIGSLPHCLQKGVGVGKRLRAEKGPQEEAQNVLSPKPSQYRPPRILPTVMLTILWLVLSVCTFLILYKLKPSVVMRVDHNNQKHIDWTQFIILYILIVLLIGLALLVGFLLWRRM